MQTGKMVYNPFALKFKTALPININKHSKLRNASYGKNISLQLA
jgi:hypothetical protein